MLILFKNSWKTFGFKLFFVLFTPQALGQNLSDQVINLKTGQWVSEQSTYIDGNRQGHIDLQNSHCLDESEANLTLQDYVNKMMNGVGADANCDFSNIQSQPGRVDFDLKCSNSIGLTTQLSMFYQYSPEQVEFEANGTLTGNGGSRPIKIEGNTRRVGECDATEKQ